MSVTKSFPLFLLLLVWTFTTRVHCQNATVSLVSTEYVEVTWDRKLQWLGVSEFHVNFTGENTGECFETIHCSSVTCTFNSVLCGVVDPCTPTKTTITGGDHTAPTLTLVTGPEKVTNFNMNLEEGVEYITWVNPSTDSSPCYDNTAVKIFFDDEEYVSLFEVDEESTNMSFCGSGYGYVEVWTQGGDGRSNSSYGAIDYTGSSVVDLLRAGNCEPVGCDDIALEWTYNPLCSDVAYLELALGDVLQNVSIGVTNLTATGLEFATYYYTCIHAKGIDGETLDTSCYPYCRTSDEKPQNLTAKALSSSSLRVTWDPPACQRYPQINYSLRACYEYYYTQDTTYDVEGLKPFEYCRVDVWVTPMNNLDDKSTWYAYTLPPAPDLRISSVTEDHVEVYWYFSVSENYGNEFYFNVTWGKSLQYAETTTDDTFIITDYNSTDEVFQVCVAAFPEGNEDLTSRTDCKYLSDADDPSDGNPWMIVGIVLGSVLLLAIVVGVTIKVKNLKAKARKGQEQQQRQEQQQQQLGQYNYGIDNSRTHL